MTEGGQVQTRFPMLEWIGIALMFTGLALGFFGDIAGRTARSAAMDGLRKGVETSESVEQLMHALCDCSSQLASALRIQGIAGIGFWTFLLGIAVFTVAARRKSRSQAVSLRRKPGTTEGPLHTKGSRAET